MNCAGVWLDIGKLWHLRNDRKLIAEMIRIIEESEEKAKKAGALLPRGLKAVLKLLFG
jgi:hypothetical protein